MEEKKAKIQNSFRSHNGSKFSINFFLSACAKHFIFKNTRIKHTAGFTLVEIIIVTAIIGILAAGFITILDPANQLRGARDGKRKSNLQQIRTALELYRADCSVYPASPLGTSISSPASCTGSVVTYLSSVPRDPKTNAPYTYSRTSNSSYQLIACLERGNDPDGSGACGSGIYYTVANP